MSESRDSQRRSVARLLGGESHGLRVETRPYVFLILAHPLLFPDDRVAVVPGVGFGAILGAQMAPEIS